MSYTIKLLEEPTIQVVGDQLYTVTKRMKVEIRSKTFQNFNERFITVPVGFITDLASIPKAFQLVYSHNSDYVRYPSILHDYMYHESDLYTRRQADLIFYYFLRQQGVNIIRANLFYLSVHLFGGLFYNDLRKR